MQTISKTFKKIEYNLSLATPMFVFYIKNIKKDLSNWIQYRGIEESDGDIYFVFKSSQSSLSFKIYAGNNNKEIKFLIRANSSKVYDYFKNLKNDNIEK